MKKTLLSVVFATCFFTLSVAGDLKVWDFGNDATTFPVSTGVGTGPFPVTVNWLEITGISTNVNMGAVNASAKTINGVAYVNRFQLNGAGYPGAAVGQTSPSVGGVDYFIPTQRFLSFNVDGNSQIKIAAVTGSNSAERILFVTDGTKLVGSLVCISGGEGVEGVINYTGSATKLYIYGNQACNLYYLSATNVIAPDVASVKEIFASKGIVISNSEIRNSNKAALEVYSVTGKRVASSKENISLNGFSKGIYIVREVASGQSLKFTI